jgi:transposase
MDEKLQFIADVLRQTRSITELCQQYNISRNTAYTLIKRYPAEGPAGLQEQSRRPHSCLHRIDDATVALIIDARRLHPRWGAKKLLKILSRKEPEREWPSRATVCNILDRSGLVVHPRNRRKVGHPGKPTAPMDEPNKVWCGDFKGHFRTRDGVYCYPLTVTDGCSR